MLGIDTGKARSDASGWIGAGVGAATGILGMLGQKKREKRQLDNQKDLMKLQRDNQMMLNLQGRDLQYDMWKKTNAQAQMKEYGKAGLNPGLMYGASGAGGMTTTGSQGGGAASGGNAPSMMPMELGAMLQAVKLGSEIALNKSSAGLKDVEANSISGGKGTVGESVIESNKASALDARSRAKLNELGFEIGNATKDDQIDKVHYEVEESISRIGMNEEQSNLFREKVVSEGVSRLLMKSNIKVNDGVIEKMVADIRQGYMKIDALYADIGVKSQGNVLRGLEGKSTISKIQADFALGVLSKNIDLMKLDIDQQRIFGELFRTLLGGAVLSKVGGGTNAVKGFKK